MPAEPVCPKTIPKSQKLKAKKPTAIPNLEFFSNLGDVGNFQELLPVYSRPLLPCRIHPLMAEKESGLRLR